MWVIRERLSRGFKTVVLINNLSDTSCTRAFFGRYHTTSLGRLPARRAHTRLSGHRLIHDVFVVIYKLRPQPPDGTENRTRGGGCRAMRSLRTLHAPCSARSRIVPTPSATPRRRELGAARESIRVHYNIYNIYTRPRIMQAVVASNYRITIRSVVFRGSEKGQLPRAVNVGGGIKLLSFFFFLLL